MTALLFWHRMMATILLSASVMELANCDTYALLKNGILWHML